MRRYGRKYVVIRIQTLQITEGVSFAAFFALYIRPSHVDAILLCTYRIFFLLESSGPRVALADVRF